MTSNVRTMEHLKRWLEGAERFFGTPDGATCMLFFKWVERPENSHARELGDLVCGNLVGSVMDLWFGPEPLPIPVTLGQQRMTSDGQLRTFGVEGIAPGLWAVSPSLNIPDTLHGFVVLYDVPEPAPFVAIEPEPAIAVPKIWMPGDPT